MPDLPEVDVESEIVGTALPERAIAPAHMPYGTYQVAAEYCGLRKPPSDFLQRGEWQHGWHPPAWIPDSEALIGSDGLSRHRRTTHTFLVAREDQREFLEKDGYTSVHSVGLPIIYEKKKVVERWRGSLLVMPMHSLEYTRHQWNFEQYAEQIAAIRHRFSAVVACLSPICFRRGYWIDAFEQQGIPVISGADIFDANTFARMATLFGRFEFVTSNGRGSQMVYSAYFGAKPSIYGTIPPVEVAEYQDTPFYQHNPELLDAEIRLNEPDELRRRFPRLFVHPAEAEDQREWGAFQLGLQCKKTPEELRHILGWDRATTSANFVRRLPKRIASKAVGLCQRMVDGSTIDEASFVQTLEAAVPGQPVIVTSPFGQLQTSNGPRVSWQLKNLLQGDSVTVPVNPATGPALDLAPGDGVSVLALARHHPDRKVYYVRAGGSEFLEKNLQQNLNGTARLQALDGPDVAEIARVAADVVVLRITVTPGDWSEVLAGLRRFTSCRLLLLECVEPQKYIGQLLASLSELSFEPHLDRLQHGRYSHNGAQSRSMVVVLPLTRSGLAAR